MQCEPSIPTQAHWQARLALICQPQVVRKALIVAVLVGSLLILLNQGDLLVSGQVTPRVLLKIVLTPLVPFCVTLLGAFLNAGNAVVAQTSRPMRLALLSSPRMIRKALVTALVVGGLLILLNHGDRLISGQVTPRVLLKIVLTPLVPFCVTLLGAFLGSGTPSQTAR